LTKYIEEEKNEFFAGSSPTLADFFLIVMLDFCGNAKTNFPKLENIYKKTLTIFPAVKKHIETRPETPI